MVFLIPAFLFIEYATARIIVIDGNKYTYLRPEAVAFIFLSIFNLSLFVFLNFGLLEKLKNGKIIKGVILNEIASPLFGIGVIGLWRATKLITHGLTNNLYSELHPDQLLYSSVLIFSSSSSIILSLHRNNKFISEYKTQLILNERQGLSESIDSTLQTENASLKAQLEQQAQQIVDLQSQLENLKKPDTQAVEYTTIEDNTEKGNRISSPQRAIFSLLVMKCYPNHSTRNELFNAINAELKSNGITTKDLKYTTLDRLIDEDLRINNLSPFPPKIK